jgi:diguanylate cyclase (GGDEF)-like protein/PAS domain S-box-containing protein
MENQHETRAQLVDELIQLRQRIAELERELRRQRRIQETTSQTREHYRRIAENAMDILFYYSYDPEHYGTQFMNGAVEGVTGYAPEEYYMDPLLGSKLAHPEDRALLLAVEDVLGQTKQPQTRQIRFIHRDGHTVHVETKFTPILDGEGDVMACVGVSRDITERRQVEQRLAYLATHDVLTGLPNRTLFNDRLTVALAHAERNRQKLAVMLLDLDHFKNVNDTLRHSVGDQLLQVVAERLTRLLRKSDTVARMGGDEFLLLFPEVSEAEDSDKIASKVMKAFRAPFVFGDHELHITTSVGVAIYPCDAEDADTLLRNADIAMYRAKARGRNNYQHYGAS